MANILVDANQRTPPKKDPCDFPFLGNIGAPLMATFNIPGLNVGLPVWLWSTLNIPIVLEDFQMNALFQGHQMGVNCSYSSQENTDFLFLLHLLIRNLKRGERRRIIRRIVLSMDHHQPLQVMLEMCLQPLQVTLGA